MQATVIINFAKARAAREASKAQASPRRITKATKQAQKAQAVRMAARSCPVSPASRARPFQARLLKPVAAKMRPDLLAAVAKAVRNGVAGQLTTDEIVRKLISDTAGIEANNAMGAEHGN